MSRENVEVVRLSVRCGSPAERRPIDVELMVRVPALARLLARFVIALPHGRLRRHLLRYGMCRLNDAFNRRDLDTLRALFHRDGKAYAARQQGAALGFDLEPVYHGPDGFRRGLETWLDAWSVFRADLVELVDLGNRVLLLHEYWGTGARSGMEVRQRNAQLYSFERGWVTEMRDYWDWAEALEAVGLPE
jgi:ketosteroid isomerase-like protein